MHVCMLTYIIHACMLTYTIYVCIYIFIVIPQKNKSGANMKICMYVCVFVRVFTSKKILIPLIINTTLNTNKLINNSGGSLCYNGYSCDMFRK